MYAYVMAAIECDLPHTGLPGSMAHVGDHLLGKLYFICVIFFLFLNYHFFVDHFVFDGGKKCCQAMLICLASFTIVKSTI